jgi:hypothetical protein
LLLYAQLIRGRETNIFCNPRTKGLFNNINHKAILVFQAGFIEGKRTTGIYFVIKTTVVKIKRGLLIPFIGKPSDKIVCVEWGEEEVNISVFFSNNMLIKANQ